MHACTLSILGVERQEDLRIEVSFGSCILCMVPVSLREAMLSYFGFLKEENRRRRRGGEVRREAEGEWGGEGKGRK